jgi:hypothetical protein
MIHKITSLLLVLKEKLFCFPRWFGIRLLWIGIDLRKILALRFTLKFLKDRAEFKHAGGVISHNYPILDEFSQQAGSASGHYFHQDLLVATYIHEAKPIRHIDVGSRIDGFVAHVATFREIEIIDVRALSDSGHKNIKFRQADLISGDQCSDLTADSISCLHALEHFGLGRYGDPIDPTGHLKGFKNLCGMLAPGGTIYISFPIGSANQVFFNAHRVFHPTEILSWIDGGFKLVRFDFVDDGGSLQRNWPLTEKLPTVIYGCGIYTIRKLN